MHKMSWGLLIGQIITAVAGIASVVSPHTALIVGGATAIGQAVFPSVFKSVNRAAADQ